MAQAGDSLDLEATERDLDAALARLGMPELRMLPREARVTVAARALEGPLASLRQRIETAWRRQVLDDRTANSHNTTQSTSERRQREYELFGLALATLLPLARKLGAAESAARGLRDETAPASPGMPAVDAGLHALADGDTSRALTLWAGAGEPGEVAQWVQQRREALADQLLEQGFLGADVMRDLEEHRLRQEAWATIQAKAIAPVQRIGTEKQREQVTWLHDEIETILRGTAGGSAARPPSGRTSRARQSARWRWLVPGLLALALLGGVGVWLAGPDLLASLGLVSAGETHETVTPPLSPTVFVSASPSPPRSTRTVVAVEATEPSLPASPTPTLQSEPPTPTQVNASPTDAPPTSTLPTDTTATPSALDASPTDATMPVTVTETVATASAITGRIAFTARRDGEDEIFVVNPDGTDATNLTRDPATDYAPTWSPDGSRIAFLSDRDGSDQIWLMNADGSEPTRLTSLPGSKGAPSWSPDGSQIVFGWQDEIYLIRVMTGTLIRLTNNPVVDTAPAWSPDGRLVVYSSFRNGNFDLFYTDTAGAPFTTLTNAPGAELGPAWAPDGRQIAFLSDRDGVQAAYLMNPDGSEQRLLVEGETDIQSISWSPDSRSLVFHTFAPLQSHLWIVNVDGTGLRRLTEVTTFDGEPAWGP